MSSEPVSRLRVLVDANVVISSLLSPDPSHSAAAAVMRSAQDAAFVLVVPTETVKEITEVVATKPWLSARVSPHALEQVVCVIRSLAEVAEPLTEPPPKVCRDRGDDYLLAQAVLAKADVLVTRDRDLLELGEVTGVRIVDPVAFLPLIRARPEPEE